MQNALDPDSYKKLGDALAALAADADVRAVITMGSEDKVFASGSDINALNRRTFLEHFNWTGTRVLNQIETLPQEARQFFELGQRHGVGMGIVATREDILQLPQHRARDFFTEVDQPGIGRLQYPGVPFKLPGLADARRPAPALGQHNTDVYRELLGYSDEDVERHFCNGII